MSEKLIDKCNKYIKKGKTDKLYRYIVKNNLTQDLITQIFYDTYRGVGNEEQEAIAMQLSSLALKLSICNLTEKYGEKLTERFANLIEERGNSKKRNFDLYRLMNCEKNVTDEIEAGKIEKILNITSCKDNIIGTHITGRGVGENYSNKGIPITGHRFISYDCVWNDYNNKEIKKVLAYNISLFENEPIEPMIQLIDNRNYRDYKNYGATFNDVMFVQIPKDELKQKQEGILIRKEEEGIERLYVNPSYIKGFARINIENGKIEDFVDNPAFVEKCPEKESVEDLSVEDWKSKFEQWNEASQTTKMQKLKLKMINFFKGLLDKEKNSEISSDTER